MKHKLLALVVCMTCIAALALAGCSGQGMEIGEKADDAVSFELENGTGQAIAEIAIQNPGDAGYGDPLKQESSLENEKKATVYVELQTSTTEEALSSGDQIAVSEYPNVKVTLADGMSYEMHNINLSDLKTATVKLEGEYAYLDYESISGEKAQTLESEKAYVEAVAAAEQAAAEQAAAEQAAAEQAAAEQAAAEQAAAQQTYVEDYSYSYSYSDSGSSSSGSGSSGSSSDAVDAGTGSESQDNCVGDQLALR